MLALSKLPVKKQTSLIKKAIKASDERLQSTMEIIREKQNEHGQWLMEYDYAGKTWLDFGEKKQPNE